MKSVGILATNPTSAQEKIDLLSLWFITKKMSDQEDIFEEDTNAVEEQQKPINRGTGAGGAKTNHNGKAFEDKTDNEPRLLASGFVRKIIPGKNKCRGGYYLEKKTDDGSIIFLKQTALEFYFQWKFNIELCRKPDEAYLFQKGSVYTLMILEKKNQNVEGSVDTKLLAGPAFIEEYQDFLGPKFVVKYGYCISAWLQKRYQSSEKKYVFLRKYLTKYSIPVLFGDAEDYMTTLDSWLNL